MVPIEEEEESSKIYVEEFVEKRLGIFTKRANANIKSWKELYDLAVALKKYRCALLVDEDELVEITERPDCWVYNLWLFVPKNIKKKELLPSARLVKKVLREKFKPDFETVQYEDIAFVICFSWYQE